MPTQVQEDSRYFMKSLAKGLVVLTAMAESARPLALTELSKATGNNNATTTRCCHTLIRMGFVRRDGQKRYHLTPKVLALGYAAIARLGWRKVAQHYMELLFERVGETVNLSVLEDGRVVYLARISSDKILSFDLQIGSRLPLHCTAMGKVLVAFASADQRQELIAEMTFEPLTHRTITSPQSFRSELAVVRAQGYAVNDEELSVGLRSVAVPILGEDGLALAAMNLAVPTARVSRTELEERLAPEAMATAREISQAIAVMGRR